MGHPAVSVAGGRHHVRDIFFGVNFIRRIIFRRIPFFTLFVEGNFFSKELGRGLDTPLSKIFLMFL